MSDPTPEDFTLLNTLRHEPRLITSYSVPDEKARLEQFVKKRLVSVVVYQQGGVIYFLTQQGRRALNGGICNEGNGYDAASKP